MHAELKRDDAVIMGGAGDAAPGSAPGLYLVVDDVDALYEPRDRRRQAIVWLPARGHRVGDAPRARFLDLDAHEWSIGTYQPGQQW